MAQRCHHYERAFEDYLRSRRIPYVAVDEARKTLLPEDGALGMPAGGGADPECALKSFDFVVYGEPHNQLVDVKGRRIPRGAGAGSGSAPVGGSGGGWGSTRRRGRLESWVTEEDVRSLRAWERLFGPRFVGSFVFVYWCDAQPPDALFQEMFEDRGRWYAVRAVSAEAYSSCMRPRSPRWRTVDLSVSDFERLSRPLSTGLCPS